MRPLKLFLYSLFSVDLFASTFIFVVSTMQREFGIAYLALFGAVSFGWALYFTHAWYSRKDRPVSEEDFERPLNVKTREHLRVIRPDDEENHHDRSA